MTNFDNIPINNGQYIEVKQSNDAIYIYTKNQYGALVRLGERISGKDFISMLNWYHYQKDHGNEELTF